MGNRQGVWWVGPDDALLSKSNGFALSVRQSTATGRVQYMVSSDRGDLDAPPSILAFGHEHSAAEGMAAAEKAASRLFEPSAGVPGSGTGASGTPSVSPLLVARVPLPKVSAVRPPRAPSKTPRQRRIRRHDALEQ